MAEVTSIVMAKRKTRSTLPKEEARQRYIEIGELMVLEQIARDAETLDQGALAVGPFARLDSAEVAARTGKTRGAINNLFSSQAAFRTETMALVLDSSDWIERIEYPDPAAYLNEDAWVTAFFEAQSMRGPAHGAEPAVSYASLWALWLSAVPYGLWSERISRAGLEEWRQWELRLETVLDGAIGHFGLRLRDGTTLNDLASAVASLVEGAWLNQCLSDRHPAQDSEPIAVLLRRSGMMLWRGAVQPFA
jgi:AcrR family transcriptional regulator